MAEKDMDGALGAIANIESSGAVKGSKEYVGALNEMERATDRTGKKIEDVEETLDNIGKSVKDTAKSFSSLEEATQYAEKLQKKIADLDTDIENFRVVKERLDLNGIDSSATEVWAKKIADAVEESIRLGEELQATQQVIAQMTEAMDAQNQAAEKAISLTKEQEEEYAKVKAVVDDYIQTASKLTTLATGESDLMTGERKTYLSKEEIDRANEAINAIRTLQKEFARLASLKGTPDEFAEGLEKMKDSIKAITSNESLNSTIEELVQQQKDVSETSEESAKKEEKAQENIRIALRKTITEITNLNFALSQMNDEELSSDAAKQMQDRLAELTEQASEMTRALKQSKDAVKNTASESLAFDAISQGIDTAISGFGGLIAVQGTFAEDQEELIEIQTKLQSVLTASNAIKTVQMNLRKQSALMRGVETAQTYAATAAENAKTMAEGKGIVVTKLATLAQKAFNAVAKANPYVLLATAILTVVGAVSAYVIGTKKAREEEKAHQAELKRTAEAQKVAAERQKAIAGAAGEVVSKFTKLQAEWKSLKTVAEKNDFIKKRKSDFDEFGTSINSIATAEKIFSSQTNAFVQAMVARAIAAKKAALAVDEYVKYVQNKPKASTGVYYVKAGDSVNVLSKEEKKKLGRNTTDSAGYDSRTGAYVAPKPLTEDEVSIINRGRTQKAVARNTQILLDNKKKEKELLDNITKTTQEEVKAAQELAGMGDKSVVKTDKDKENAEKKKVEERKRLNEELQALEQQNIDDTIKIREDGTAKEIAEINNSYNKRLAAIKKTEEDWKNRNKESNMKGVLTEGDDAGLTKAQAKALREARSQAEQERAKLEATARNKDKQREREAETEYLKEYGTSQEQRLAIAREYDDKISKLIADNASEIEIKTVQKQKDRALADFDFEQMKKGIDWEYIFGDLENVNTETLKVVNEQLKEFMDRSAELTPDQIQAVVEAMLKVQDAMDLSTPIASIKNARSAYKAAKKEYDEYAKAYEAAKAAGDKAGMDKAQKGMTKADQQMTKAKNKEAKAFNEVTGTVNNYAEALKAAGEAIGGATGDCLKLAASAIQAGVGMANGIKAFGNAVSAMEKSVAILAIIEAALQAIQMIAKLFGDSADQTLTNYVAAMDTYLNLLKDDINAMNDAMKNNQNTIKETVKYYQELIELEKKQALGIKSQSQTWLNSGASKGFLGIGSSSSEGVKIAKNIESQLKSSNKEVQAFYQKGYDQLNEYFRKVNGKYADSASGFGRMDFIWKLSDDDLRKLAKDTEAMALLGDELGGAVKKYVDAIGEATDALDAKLEAVLGVSFEEFYDDFTDMIKNMDNSSADFAKNFGQYLNDALVKNMVADKYKAKLQELWKWAAMAMEGGYLEKNMEYYRNEYQKISEEAQREAEMIAKITGVTEQSNQEAMANAIESITADQADQLIGRITAMQIAVEAIHADQADNLADMKEYASLMQGDVSTIKGYIEEQNGYISEIVDIQYESNRYLHDIAKHTSHLEVIAEDITRIKENTSRL